MVTRKGPPAEKPDTAEVEADQREAADELYRQVRVASMEVGHGGRHAITAREWLAHRSPAELHRGRPSGVACHEATGGVWLCTLRFANGVVLVNRVAWYGRAQSEGVSIVSERGG